MSLLDNVLGNRWIALLFNPYHEPAGSSEGGQFTSSNNNVSEIGTTLSKSFSEAGIDKIKSGNCWVFASAAYEKLKSAGETPKIIDWGGHVEAATKQGDSWLAYTPDGPTPFEKHWMTRVKKKVFRIYDSPSDLFKEILGDDGLLNANQQKIVFENLHKAEKIVGVKWQMPKPMRD